MGRFTREENYCPKLGHAVTALGVCERRSMEAMAPAWPTCTGCSYKEVLEKPDGQKNLTTMSDPPPQWYNMDRYKELLGEDVCRRRGE
jgi:hypothetical protein